MVSKSPQYHELHDPAGRWNLPYIFISCSSADSASCSMADEFARRYRCWYDKDFLSFSSTTEEVFERIKNCSVFLALLSKEYFDYGTTMDEFLFARDQNKPIVLISMEKVEISPGWQKTISRYPQLDFRQYPDSEEFWQTVSEVDDLKSFAREDGQNKSVQLNQASSDSEEDSAKHNHNHSKATAKNAGILALSLILTLVVLSGVGGLYYGKRLTTFPIFKAGNRSSQGGSTGKRIDMQITQALQVPGTEKPTGIQCGWLICQYVLGKAPDPKDLAEKAEVYKEGGTIPENLSKALNEILEQDGSSVRYTSKFIPKEQVSEKDITIFKQEISYTLEQGLPGCVIWFPEKGDDATAEYILIIGTGEQEGQPTWTLLNPSNGQTFSVTENELIESMQRFYRFSYLFSY